LKIETVVVCYLSKHDFLLSILNEHERWQNFKISIGRRKQTLNNNNNKFFFSTST